MEDQSAKNKVQQRKTALEPTAAVGGMSIDMAFARRSGTLLPLSAISYLLSPTAGSLGALLLMPTTAAFPSSGFVPVLLLPPL